MAALPVFNVEIHAVPGPSHPGGRDPPAATLRVTDAQRQLTFANIVGAVRHYLPTASARGFQYVDDDGDLITVRNDEETVSMIKTFVQSSFDRSVFAFREPLLVFPLMPPQQQPVLAPLPASPLRQMSTPASASPLLSSSSPGPPVRNLHGLRVSTDASPPPHAVGSSASSAGSSLASASPLATAVVSSAASTGSLSGNDMAVDWQPSDGGGGGGGGGGSGDLGGGRFRFDPATDLMGRGTSGAVYAATDSFTGRRVALKVVALDMSPEVRRQIAAELSILHRCRSPHIVAFYGALFREGDVCMATEFMDGGSLDRYGRVPITGGVLGRVGVMVVRGLLYLWKESIMHRDVKPSNMLVNTQGVVKLCDFGVSAQLVSSVASTYCGTNAYMSPERLQGGEYRVQSDLWSLGVSLYEMAAGRLPFDFGGGAGGDAAATARIAPLELMNCIVSGVVLPLPDAVAAGAPGLGQFVAQCLQKQPEERPSPRSLPQHPFVALHDDGNTEPVGAWVRARLEDMRFRSIKRH